MFLGPEHTMSRVSLCPFIKWNNPVGLLPEPWDQQIPEKEWSHRWQNLAENCYRKKIHPELRTQRQDSMILILNMNIWGRKKTFLISLYLSLYDLLSMTLRQDPGTMIAKVLYQPFGHKQNLISFNFSVLLAIVLKRIKQAKIITSVPGITIPKFQQR